MLFRSLDADTGLMTKIVFSLKEINEKILDNAYGDDQPRPMAGIWGAVSTLVYSNYGSAPDFEVPKEVKENCKVVGLKETEAEKK